MKAFNFSSFIVSSLLASSFVCLFHTQQVIACDNTQQKCEWHPASDYSAGYWEDPKPSTNSSSQENKYEIGCKKNTDCSYPNNVELRLKKPANSNHSK